MDQLICDALLGEFDAEIALSPGFRWGNSVLPGQPVTMEDVLTETAMTYPETYVLKMTGSQIKDVLEDVCDNLFNADPYYQQGGDMVRVGGLAYACSPAEAVGHRISDLKLGQRQVARSRQELQSGGMGVRQRTAGRAGVGCVRQASARRKNAGPARHRRHLEGRRRQSGHRGTGMTSIRTNRRSTLRALGSAVIAALMVTAAACRGAGAAAGQAVRRAPHRAAALGQRRGEAGPRHQRRQ